MINENESILISRIYGDDKYKNTLIEAYTLNAIMDFIFHKDDEDYLFIDSDFREVYERSFIMLNLDKFKFIKDKYKNIKCINENFNRMKSNIEVGINDICSGSYYTASYYLKEHKPKNGRMHTLIGDQESEKIILDAICNLYIEYGRYYNDLEDRDIIAN